MARKRQRQRRYSWKNGTTFKVDAQACGERVELLRQQTGRALHRRDILADALDPDSPFHAEVFHDVPAEAERKWRLEVCGRILRCLEYTVVYIEKGTHNNTPTEIPCPVVSFVRGVGYETTAVVLTDVDMKRQALAEIIRQLRAYQQKLARYETLAVVFNSLLAEAQRLYDTAAGDDPRAG